MSKEIDELRNMRLPVGRLPGKVTPAAYRLPDKLSWEEWYAVGLRLQEAEGRVAIRLSALWWWLGDWLRYGEQHWPKEFAQAVDELKARYSDTTLRQMMWVAERIPAVNRLTGLSWPKHRAVAALPEPEQRVVLEQVLEEGWTLPELRSEVSQRRRRSAYGIASTPTLQTAPPASGESSRTGAEQELSTAHAETIEDSFDEGKEESELEPIHAVYAVPHWRLGPSDEGVSEEDLRVALDDIVVASNAVAFIWAPPARLQAAMGVLRAWGFTYKTSAVRVRPPGDYLPSTDGCLWFRPRHELLLVGVRGILPPVAEDAWEGSVIESGPEELQQSLSAWMDGQPVYKIR